MKLTSWIFMFVIILLAGCSKDANTPQLPVVITLEATGVTSDSAVLNGEVVTDNNSAVTARGLCWSPLPAPGLDDSVINCSAGKGKYSSIISSLNDSQSYFYRAFATNAAGTAFGEEKTFTTPDKFVPFSGGLISHSECNHYRANREVMLDDSLSCAEYSFDAETHTLRITHYNAGFNCCPINISCEITLSNDTIFIEELEEMDFCNCLCLYDLEIEVTGLNAQAYHIKFIEPYCQYDQPLIFPVNLSTTPDGTSCAARHHYPWGM